MPGPVWIVVLNIIPEMVAQRIEEEAWTLSQEMAERGKFVDCLFVREHLHTALETVHGHEHMDVAASLNNIGIVYNSQGKYDLALEKHEESLHIKIKIFGYEHPDVATSLNSLGLVYRKLGDLDKALEYHEKALAIEIKFKGHEHLDVANTEYKIALLKLQQGNASEAAALFQHCAEVYTRVYGPDHSETVDAREQVQQCT